MITLEAGEADVVTGANLGWRTAATLLGKCMIEFDMLWLPSDAGLIREKRIGFYWKQRSEIVEVGERSP
jgi:hypothetical protein